MVESESLCWNLTLGEGLRHVVVEWYISMDIDGWVGGEANSISGVDAYFSG